MVSQEKHALMGCLPFDQFGKQVSITKFQRQCPRAIDEMLKWTEEPFQFLPHENKISPRIAFVRKTIDSTIPYVLLMLVAMVVTVVFYFPAAVALVFIAGAYASKLALDLNKRLGIVNPAYIKAALIACSGLALETIILLLARAF